MSHPTFLGFYEQKPLGPELEEKENRKQTNKQNEWGLAHCKLTKSKEPHQTTSYHK